MDMTEYLHRENYRIWSDLFPRTDPCHFPVPVFGWSRSRIAAEKLAYCATLRKRYMRDTVSHGRSITAGVHQKTIQSLKSLRTCGVV